MIRKRSEMTTDRRERMRDGEGTVSITHMVTREEMQNGRLFAWIELPVGASIGPHTHDGETEYYAILSGKGEVTESDGVKQVTGGDMVITGNGASHSIANTGNDPLQFIAVINYDET